VSGLKFAAGSPLITKVFGSRLLHVGLNQQKGYITNIFAVMKRMEGRPRWPRFLKHDLSSLARTLGLWVRIPLKGMVVCVYVAALRRADHESKESCRLCKKDYETEEEPRAQRKGCSAIDK
jgi:hypothetical protein